MSDAKMLKTLCKLADHYRITDGKKFRLKHFAPNDTSKYDQDDKEHFETVLQAGIARLSEYQDKLYARAEHGVLLIFQAMDAAGKDGTIKHVMSGINPQGCRVTSFKAPSHLELRHDFLWRCALVLPERGGIAIFNRSYYEEVLAVRVHPEFLADQNLPPKLAKDSKIWEKRLCAIRNWEKNLVDNGFLIRKFFLHLSKEEQKKRFLERLETPSKNWKFSTADLSERAHWDEYQHAYEKAIRATATPEAPWYVVPADNKWYARAVVSGAVVDALASISPAYPKMDAGMIPRLESARQSLLNEE